MVDQTGEGSGGNHAGGEVIEAAENDENQENRAQFHGLGTFAGAGSARISILDAEAAKGLKAGVFCNFCAHLAQFGAANGVT